MRQLFQLVWVFIISLSLLGFSGCSSANFNSDYNLNQARLKENAKASAGAIASADTTKPTIELPKEETEEKESKRKKKRNKRYFLGYKIKRGFVKSGGSGDREVLETFGYLPEFEDPNPYAPEKYLLDTKKNKLYRTRTQLDPDRHKVLHGPYVKKVGGQVVEEGYFYIGTKHLRWERYRNDEEGTLVDKKHYEKGFPRDAVITYYGDTKKIKEVIPYQYGEVQGMYYRFYENGQVEWSGQYEKGRKVGTWIKHYDFRNRRHYEYQYPESAYDKPAEPYLVKQYDRHGTLIYEKDKLDKRSQAKR